MMRMPGRPKKESNTNTNNNDDNNEKLIMDSNHGDGGWQFVNISQLASAKDAELRKIVRSRAMLHYRTSQKKLRERSLSKPSFVESTHPSTMFLDSLNSTSWDLRSSSSGHQTGNRASEGFYHENGIRPDGGKSLSKETRIGSYSLLSFDSQHPGQAALSSGNVTPSLHPEYSLELDTIASSPQWLLGSGDKDPFDSFPVKGCPRHSELLHHCK